MYIRSKLECGPKSEQPGHSIATDVYGNSFENWCVDYIGSNGKTGCAPQDPKGFLGKFVFHTFDNSVRTPEQYIKSPYIAGSFIYENIDGSTVVVLGMEEDRDLVLFRENNQAYLQLEPNTQVSTEAVYT